LALLLMLLATATAGGCNAGNEAGTVLEVDEEMILEAEVMRSRGGFRGAAGGFRRATGGLRGAIGRAGRKASRLGRKARKALKRHGKKAGNGLKKAFGRRHRVPELTRLSESLKRVGGKVVHKFIKRAANGITGQIVGNIRNEATRRGHGSGSFDQWIGQTKSGKIAISSQDSKIATQLCLHEAFYCYIDCPSAFQLECKVDNAQIYSIQVGKDEHLKRCVQPKIAQGQLIDNCYWQACACSMYEDWFFATVGKKEYGEALGKVQDQCNGWCTTGKQPANVWNKAQFTTKMSKAKKVLKWFKNGFKAIGKVIGKAFKAVGKAFKKIGKKLKRIFGRRRR